MTRANVFSWEHGLIREEQPQNLKTQPPGLLMARGEGDAPDIDGRVYIRGKLRLATLPRWRSSATPITI